MKKIKGVFGFAAMAAMLTAGTMSFTAGDSNNEVERVQALELQLRSCPSGMAGYRCVWDYPPGTACPVTSEYGVGVWNCYTKEF